MAVSARPVRAGMVGVKLDDPTLKVVAVPFTPEYRQAVEAGARLVQQGLFPEDPAH